MGWWFALQRESDKVAKRRVENRQDLIHCNGPDFVILSRQILDDGSCLRFEAKGHSMDPFIRESDIVVVEPADFSQLRLGEIILYHISDEAVLAHRIVGRMQQDGVSYLLARGDAVLGLDGPVSSAQILGRITTLERRGCLVRVDSRGRRWLGLAYSNGRVVYRRGLATLRRLAVVGKATLRQIVRGVTGW